MGVIIGPATQITWKRFSERSQIINAGYGAGHFERLFIEAILINSDKWSVL